MALFTTEYSSLLQKITELETTVRGIQVNIEVNGHCGYDNDTTVPLFQNSGVDKANSLPARANKAIRPREDPVPVAKPTGASPPWNTLGAKPKKSYPLQRLTGRAKRPDINNETDWPALASQTAASTSTHLSAQAQKWTSAKGRSITKSQTQFHVELGNRFAPLLNDQGSGSNEGNTQPSGTAKTESASGKQKRHDVSVKDAQKMFSSNVKVICLPNDTISDLADKILHIVADYPHLKNVVIHCGLNDLAKEESEVLKQDFTHLLKTVSCIQPKAGKMSLSTLKKRKVDSENRQFNNEWTEKYAFIAVDANPVCLICNECLAVSKEYNLRRHFNTTHAKFNTTFPPGSAARKQKISGLTLSASLRKTRKSVIDSIWQIPISDTSNIRRVESLASDVFETLMDKLRKAEVMSLAVDESTDNSDVAQLCLYVQFYDGACFHEDLLGLIPLEGQTTGEILFAKISAFFEENNLDLARINMLVTDGAPSMVGRDQGLAARMAAVAPQMRSLHCLIHQSLLCAKLSGELKETMDSVMAIINFIRCTSSLQHRLFRKLLADMSAEYKDLLIHNDIRWLSKGNALKRFCELKEEILVFLQSSKLKKAGKFLSLMGNNEFNATVCFLSDVFYHLNQLNMELQGRDKTVFELVEKLRAFQRKLSLFSADLCPEKMLHFPTLRKSGLQITEADFALKGKELVPSLDESFLQLELIDIQSSDDLQQSLQQAGYEKFWTHVVSQEKFPHSRGLALFLLTMFGSTYTCESSFSHMNAIKTHNRISLTDQNLQHCLRIALSTYTPDFTALAKSKKCHFSH
uniref:HAT C-terminal dimerisation domain-containing protein n=1 Tax=Gouania willdenowi TaxID=441366 RepID=A0A8C5ET12_GOUWI